MEMRDLFERQKARRVKALAGVKHRSGTDTDLMRAEFASQKPVSKLSTDTLHHLAGMQTVGHNPKLRKQARKFLRMRAEDPSACPPGQKMVFGTCRKVGVKQEDVLVEYEVHVNKKGWANDDEGNRWYVGDRWGEGTYFGREAAQIVASGKDDEETRYTRGGGRKRNAWEDTGMRTLLRRLEEGRGVKPVVSWDGIVKDIVGDLSRLSEIGVELINGSRSRSDEWDVSDLKVKKKSTTELVVEMPFSRDFERTSERWSKGHSGWSSSSEDADPAEAWGHVTFTLKRDPRGSSLTFQIEWQYDGYDNCTPEGDKKAKGSVDVEFEDFAKAMKVDDEDWYTMFNKAAKGLPEPGDFDVENDSNEPDWDSMPGGHDYDR